MTDISRRNFIKLISITAAGAGTIGLSGIVGACSSKNETSKVDSTNEPVALRVSSDTYKTDLKQRVAFSIFNQDREVVSTGSVAVTLTSPAGKKQVFDKVQVREKGIPNQGIYSLSAVLNEVGPWKLETNFKNQPLDLTFEVTQVNVAPALASECPTAKTPTNSDPLDAEILCTRFKGECGLHEKSVPELLATKKPFVVIFATPARCQTNYCGPVLDLTREVAQTTSIPVIHIEIYKSETSSETLDAVTDWNLATEPWMFGVTSEGKIDSRLDGAFDKSEIEELFAKLN